MSERIQTNGQQSADPAPGGGRVTVRGGQTQAEADLIDKITQSDLSPGSKQILKDLLTKETVLANLSEAKAWEFHWDVHILRELFYAQHPDDRCLVTGEDRAFINADPSDTLTPLSERERLAARQIFRYAQLRLTRGEEMAQQEMIKTDIKESRVDRPDDDSDSGGLIGMIGD